MTKRRRQEVFDAMFLVERGVDLERMMMWLLLHQQDGGPHLLSFLLHLNSMIPPPGSVPVSVSYLCTYVCSFHVLFLTHLGTLTRGYIIS